MGSGKSTIAKSLGKKLNLKVVEMDSLIVTKAGKKINQIFKDDGEKRFRELESQVAIDQKNEENVVISTGGGIITNENNILNLKRNGKMIFLKTSFLEIKKRLKNTQDRPLFKNIKSAKKLFNDREKLYEKFADLVVITDKKSVDEIAYEIISQN